MKIDLKIIEEIHRYNQINKYVNEQELPPPPAGEGEIPPPPPTDTTIPPATDVTTPPPPPPATEVAPVPVDVENDPDVEKLDNKKEKKVEVTDLVKSQKTVEEKQEQYFETLFGHLSDLENKLSAMDDIINRLNNIETKIEKYREKTPEEKLELRSLDSGPFNQKLSQFFQDKEDEMEQSGKNEYVLTSDEVESYSPNEIKRSFRDFSDTEMTPENDISKFKKIY